MSSRSSVNVGELGDRNSLIGIGKVLEEYGERQTGVDATLASGSFASEVLSYTFTHITSSLPAANMHI